jgi:cytochrome c2
MDLPMNWDGVRAFADNPNFAPGFFRSLDLLAAPVAPHEFDLYASYARYTGECFEIVVARRRAIATEAGIELDGANWEDVFVAEPCLAPKSTSYVFAGHQIGGRLALLDADTLLLSIGDAELDGDRGTPDGPQNPDWDIGKIVAISLADGSTERLALGFRNPQGLLIDSSGRIWESEHGPLGGDEVNLVRRGANYGWPLVTYGLPYHETSSPLTAFDSHDGFERPAFVFTPAVAPSQMIEPSVEEFPFWRSSIILSSLKNESLYVLRVDGDDIVSSEPVFIDFRIRDILSRPNGQIAMVTEERAGGGNLILMRARAEGRDSAPFQVADMRERNSRQTQAEPATAAESGRQVFEQACATCHSLSGAASAGPPLNGVVGRDIGSIEGFAYSDALAHAGGDWTPRRLRSFLANPSADFAGSTMPESGLSEAQADAVIAYLRTTR